MQCCKSYVLSKWGTLHRKPAIAITTTAATPLLLLTSSSSALSATPPPTTTTTIKTKAATTRKPPLSISTSSARMGSLKTSSQSTTFVSSSNSTSSPGKWSPGNLSISKKAAVASQYQQKHTLARHRKPSKSFIPISKPHYVLKQESKKVLRKNPSQVRKNPSGHIIISCKRKELNHHRGDVYGNCSGTPIDLKHLASGGWLHYKSKGDYFTINPHAKNHVLDRSISFAQLGIRDQLTETLNAQGLMHPSSIQVETIPQILGKENVLCAAGTGCGKTLAYLLPILQQLYEFRQFYVPDDQPNHTCPRAVLILPSKELVDQITSVAQPFCNNLGLSMLSVCGGRENHKLISRLNAKPRDVDILVSTPGSLLILLGSGAIRSALVNHVVIDEADTLMDDSFNDLTLRLLRKLSMKSTGILGVQLVFVSATFPRDLQRILSDAIQTESFTQCAIDSLHQVIGNISQKFIRMGPQEKMDVFKQIMSENQEFQTIVFANTYGTAGYLQHFLRENHMASLLLHSQIPEDERQGVFKSFQDGSCKILVCSDIGSRGLNTLNVKRVINYDIPRYMSDYVHRAGRVGRLGSATSGKVINLVGHRPELKLVWEIERAVRGGKRVATLPNVNANIYRQITRKIERKYPEDPEDFI